MTLWNILFLRVVFASWSRRKWLQRSLKTASLKCNIQTFVRQLFYDITTVQLLAAEDSHILSSKMFMKTWHLSHVYYAFDTIKLRLFFLLWQQFHKLWQLVSELRTLHGKSLVIGRFRLLKSDNDNFPSTKLHGNRLPNI